MPPLALELTHPTLDVGVVAHKTASMQRFYGEVLGLERAPSILVPGGEVMVHRVGASALKLWCLDSPPPAFEGGVDAAVGYRLLTFLLPDHDIAGPLAAVVPPEREHQHLGRVAGLEPADPVDAHIVGVGELVREPGGESIGGDVGHVGAATVIE